MPLYCTYKCGWPMQALASMSLLSNLLTLSIHAVLDLPFILDPGIVPSVISFIKQGFPFLIMCTLCSFWPSQVVLLWYRLFVTPFIAHKIEEFKRKVYCGWMFLLVPAHPGCPGQIPQSRKMVVLCVCVCVLWSAYMISCILFILSWFLYHITLLWLQH